MSGHDNTLTEAYAPPCGGPDLLRGEHCLERKTFRGEQARGAKC